MALNLAANFSYLSLSFFSLVYLKKCARLKQAQPLILKFLALSTYAWCEPLIWINFYRDFDWSGVWNLMSIFGYRKILDPYRPFLTSFEANAWICARTLLAGLLIYLFQILWRLWRPVINNLPNLPNLPSKKNLLKKTSLEVLISILGLWAWNIPGWVASQDYNVYQGNWINYVIFSFAQGFLGGFCEVFLAHCFKLNPQGVLNLEPARLIKKNFLAWIPGALWNLSYLVQSMGSFESTNFYLKIFALSAFNLALTCAIANSLFFVFSNLIDFIGSGVSCFNLKNLHAWSDQKLGFNKPIDFLNLDLNFIDFGSENLLEILDRPVPAVQNENNSKFANSLALTGLVLSLSGAAFFSLSSPLVCSNFSIAFLLGVGSMGLGLIFSLVSIKISVKKNVFVSSKNQINQSLLFLTTPVKFGSIQPLELG